MAEFQGYYEGTVLTAVALVWVDGHLDGGLRDWPSHIQDGIGKAVETFAHLHQKPMVVVDSWCEYEGISERHFLKILISEVIAVVDGPPPVMH